MKTAEGCAWCHERFVDLEGLEDGRALGGFVLLAHAGADVGVDGVGAGDGLDGVVGEGDGAAGGLGDLDGLVDDVELGLEAFGRGDGAVRAELRGGEHERVADVVAVADVGELRPSTEPKRSSRVMKSAMAWQGCSRSESALMTGTLELAAISVMVSCE